MFGERRKTGGPGFGPRISTAITPTKRFTDVGAAASVRKTDSRLSMGQPGGQHRASLFQRNSAAAPRDVKSMLGANVSKIYNFFIEFEGSDAPAEAQIRNPKGRNDFINFFELLYQHLSCDYEFPPNARVEDEIIHIFKCIGYPVSLKNSYFQPMGSSHGYPHLVDALAWLVDFIRCNKCVSDDTQNIIFGDFLEPAKVQEKTLSYAWMSSIFREYTNDRKAAETRDGPFWTVTKEKLKDFFEKMNEAQGLAASLKNALEQIRFECEEIEADRGQGQTLLEEINKMKDDMRKAVDYNDALQTAQRQREIDLEKAMTDLEIRMKENSEVQADVNELKQQIEEQKEKHGLTGKEVRQLNLENTRDKAVISEIQAELDKLSKELWLKKNEENFKDKRAIFVQLAEKIGKIVAEVHIDLGLESLRSPQNERELKSEQEKMNSVWLPEVTRQLRQKQLNLNKEKSFFRDKFAAAEERVQIKKVTLCEDEKEMAREERLRRNEREEWKEIRLVNEKRYDELENEQDVLKKQMQRDGSLDKEIELEMARKLKIDEESSKKKSALEAKIRQKLDQILVETSKINNEKLMFHSDCQEFEKQILKTRNMK